MTSSRLRWLTWSLLHPDKSTVFVPAGYATSVVALPVTVSDDPGCPSNRASTRDKPLVVTEIVRDGRSSVVDILVGGSCPRSPMQ